MAIYFIFAIFYTPPMYNVLIADDDVDAWFQLNALLRRHLIKASFVTNLNAARHYIDKHITSLLFFDKQPQDNSTLDFIKYVRSRYPGVKIILINTYGEVSANIKAKADLIINKPLIPATIEQAIIKLLFPQEALQAALLH